MKNGNLIEKKATNGHNGEINGAALEIVEEKCDDTYDFNVGRVCMAKWNRAFYPGFVNEIAKNSTNSTKKYYTIAFEDGASKNVLESSIIFGDFNSPILPILNHFVSVIEANNKTLAGICVEAIKESEEEDPRYSIITENCGTLTVCADQLFMTEDQVKMLRGTYKPNEHQNGNGLRRSGRKRGRDASGRDGSPQPGPSGLCLPKRSKKTETVDSDDSDFSDLEPEPIKKKNLWDIEGVQTEKLVIQIEQDRHKMKLFEEYGENLETILGQCSENSKIFKGKCFLITCTNPLNEKKKSLLPETTLSTLPFDRNHLENQIRAANGSVYQSFESIPKSKYKMCRLIAPYPCLTPKFIQCLSAGIPILRHDFIIDCCNESKLLDFKKYILPSGYSVLEEKYINWSQDRNIANRKQFLPFKNSTVTVGSFETDFLDFWSQVCKSAGALVRIAKRPEDITPTMNGYLLLDFDFFCRNKTKVEYYNIPIVSTVFIVESLICGKIVNHEASHLLKQPFDDEDEPET